MKAPSRRGVNKNQASGPKEAWGEKSQKPVQGNTMPTKETRVNLPGAVQAGWPGGFCRMLLTSCLSGRENTLRPPIWFFQHDDHIIWSFL